MEIGRDPGMRRTDGPIACPAADSAKKTLDPMTKKVYCVRIYRLNYLVLDPLGGLARRILPPLSPSQPVIAEKEN